MGYIITGGFKQLHCANARFYEGTCSWSSTQDCVALSNTKVLSGTQSWTVEIIESGEKWLLGSNLNQLSGKCISLISKGTFFETYLEAWHKKFCKKQYKGAFSHFLSLSHIVVNMCGLGLVYY